MLHALQRMRHSKVLIQSQHFHWAPFWEPRWQNLFEHTLTAVCTLSAAQLHQSGSFENLWKEMYCKCIQKHAPTHTAHIKCTHARTILKYYMIKWLCTCCTPTGSTHIHTQMSLTSYTLSSVAHKRYSEALDLFISFWPLISHQWLACLSFPVKHTGKFAAFHQGG